MEAAGVIMAKKKLLVDRNYTLCGGCKEIWHLKESYSCVKCEITMQLANLQGLLKSVYENIDNLVIGKIERPMIERE
jgi:hypothetical protein